MKPVPWLNAIIKRRLFIYHWGWLYRSLSSVSVNSVSVGVLRVRVRVHDWGWTGIGNGNGNGNHGRGRAKGRGRFCDVVRSLLRRPMKCVKKRTRHCRLVAVIWDFHQRGSQWTRWRQRRCWMGFHTNRYFPIFVPFLPTTPKNPDREYTLYSTIRIITSPATNRATNQTTIQQYHQNVLHYYISTQFYINAFN